MATDSTELTFVRCHSCRSLVPAVSTRCRMCGATLDAAAGQADGGAKSADRAAREKPANSETPRTEPRSPGRIRQRTMSQPDTEFAAAVRQVRSDSKEATAVLKAETNAAVDLTADDPLADYLAGSTSTVAVESAAVKSMPTNGNGKHHHDTETPVLAKSVSAVQPVAAAPKMSIPAETATVVAAKPEVSAQPSAHRSEARAPEARSHDRKEERATITSAASMAVHPSRPLQGMRRAEAIQGRLFGWLVSYTDADGKAIELREGKFFVTGNSLKESDLIINDKSISTPHALLSVTSGGGFQVQDLMSERGVFVRRSNGGAYQKFDDVISLDHGDWIRFGDVEFLVCLVAHVGQL